MGGEDASVDREPVAFAWDGLEVAAKLETPAAVQVEVEAGLDPAALCRLERVQDEFEAARG